MLKRSSSGETLSITGRAGPNWRPEEGDEDNAPGVKTKIARPFSPAASAPRPSPAAMTARASDDDLRPTLEREQSFSGVKSTTQSSNESFDNLERAAVRRPMGLIITIVVIALLITGVGVLYLLDLLPRIPLPSEVLPPKTPPAAPK